MGNKESGKKVLLVSEIFPPDIGGPATFIPRLAEELSTLGNSVKVICTSDQIFYPEDNSATYKIYRISRRTNRLFLEIRLLIRLLILMPWADQVFINGLEYQTALVSKLLRRKFVAKIVGDSVWEAARNSGATLANIDDFQNEKKLPPAILRIKLRRDFWLKQTTQIITPSYYLKTLVSKWEVKSEKITVVLNGVPIPDSAKGTSINDRSTVFKIGFVGRLTNWKGVDALLLALRDFDDIEFHIFGDGPEYPALVDLSKRLNLNSATRRIIFHGKIAHSEMHNSFKSIDVLALISLYEGLSHTLLEAGHFKIPCIASNRGGNPEVIVNGESGYLVDPFDIKTIVDCIKNLKNDPDLRKKMGSKLNTAINEKFSFEMTIKGTIDALSKIK